jgi:hypothetical protein
MDNLKQKKSVVEQCSMRKTPIIEKKRAYT